MSSIIEKMRATSAPELVAVDTVWGVVYVGPLLLSDVESIDKTEAGMAAMVAKIMLDEKGERIFDVSNEEHLALIRKQKWAELNKVIEASNTVNGRNKEGREAVKNA